MNEEEIREAREVVHLRAATTGPAAAAPPMPSQGFPRWSWRRFPAPIRPRAGIWLEENLAAGPVFQGWMELPALRQLGVEIVGPRTVGSTDHAAFTRVGLPGFQFIQERLEYRSRTHHSTMDTVDRVQAEDAEQQVVVAALFAWLTSRREEPIPRKP